jgi:ribA/ribD-fused uncharacterized protein
MQYNNDWLIKKSQEGENIQFLFFWGHRPSKDGSITKTCFSQWWLSSFNVEGHTYLTAEHWMMASKAKLFGDDAIISKILEAPTPAEAKKLGRKVKNFDAELWEQHKFQIVVEGNFHKFTQHPALKIFLLNTAEKVLVEASPVDAVWGIGMAEDNPEVHHPASWRGENLLGYALMEVRDQLK